jgi:nucleoside 2-deoxyribosyltransferase
MRVYLAAPYVKKNEIKAYATELRAGGVEVTSSWLDEPHDPSMGPKDLTPKQNQKYAVTDVFDVRRAQVFVLFTDKTKAVIRAGRHVEFGVAVERSMPIYVVGEERENIFHYLPFVTHVDSWERLRDYLIAMAAR